MARNYCGTVLTVRPASLHEVRDVQMRVLRPAGPLPTDVPPGPDWLHVAALDDGRVVGGCSAGPAQWPRPDLCDVPGPTWQLRAMAVLPGHRGGTGRMLLLGVTTSARAAGAHSLWAAARTAALGLYTAAGWRELGGTWDEPGVGPHRYVALAGREGMDP
jgi:hypothetical protein